MLQTPNQLYATYLAAVAVADADYLDAVADRDAAIASARAAAQADADDLYADYEDAVATAQATYDAAVEDADDDYQAAIADADAAWTTATATDLATYESAFDDAQDDYDAARALLDVDYADAIAAADDDYDDYIEPYQTARDDAYDAWQLDPENSGLEDAYNDAQDALDAAIATAQGQRDDDFAAAAAIYGTGLSEAQADLLTARAEAYEDYLTAIASADEDWNDAEAAAWAVYLVAKENAEADFIAAEDAAWDGYRDDVALIEDALATTEASIESQYATAVAAGVSAWDTDESAAWSTYTTAMAALPGSPALAEPIDAPPVLEAFVGCQLGARQQPGNNPEQETPLQMLNRWWDEINTRSNEVAQARTAIDTDFAFLALRRQDMVNAANANDFSDAWAAYQVRLGALLGRLNTVERLSREIMDRGRLAADQVQGMRFRVLGIEGRLLDYVNQHLGPLMNQLDAERQALTGTGQVVDPAVVTQAQLDGMAALVASNGTFVSRKNRLNAFLGNIEPIRRAAAANDQVPQEHATAFGQLNGHYQTMQDHLGAAYLGYQIMQFSTFTMQNLHSLTLNSFLTEWVPYMGATIAVNGVAFTQSIVIADRDAQGVLKTTSTFGVATAARDHASVSQNEVPVDQFAYRGVKRFVELFVYLLQAEGAAVVAEKVWLENLTNPPQPPQVLGPFSSHQNLEAAEAMLNTTVDAAPAF